MLEEQLFAGGGGAGDAAGRAPVSHPRPGGAASAERYHRAIPIL